MLAKRKKYRVNGQEKELGTFPITRDLLQKSTDEGGLGGRLPLTKKVIDCLVADDAKEYFVWDDEVTGFGIRCWPSGRRVYLVQYRQGGGRSGRTRRVVVGDVGTLTPDEARRIAREKLADALRGDDPAENRDKRRQGMTLGDLAERYFNEHSLVKKKPRTSGSERVLLDKHILPALGKFKVADVSRAQVAKFLHDMRKNPVVGNRCIALLSHMFTMADIWGIRTDGVNPCRGVPRYKENKRRRYLSDDEVRRLMGALDAAQEKRERYNAAIKTGVKFEEEGVVEHPSAIVCIRLLLATGCRLGEVLTLKWGEVNLERGELNLSDSKTGEKTVALSSQAAALIRNHQRLELNPYVCYGQVAGGHFIGVHKAWERIAAAAKLTDCRIHDLRHSYASAAAAAGMSLTEIGKLLGHNQTSTTARYAHLSLEHLKQAAQVVADKIEEMGKAEPKVVPIRKR